MNEIVWTQMLMPLIIGLHGGRIHEPTRRNALVLSIIYAIYSQREFRLVWASRPRHGITHTFTRGNDCRRREAHDADHERASRPDLVRHHQDGKPCHRCPACTIGKRPYPSPHSNRRLQLHLPTSLGKSSKNLMRRPTQAIALYPLPGKPVAAVDYGYRILHVWYSFKWPLGRNPYHR